jgi:ribosome maturation protein Sdo1
MTEVAQKFCQMMKTPNNKASTIVTNIKTNQVGQRSLTNWSPLRIIKAVAGFTFSVSLNEDGQRLLAEFEMFLE